MKALWDLYDIIQFFPLLQIKIYFIYLRFARKEGNYLIDIKIE
jgi:hypothetical protein